ncbi:MAG: polysaccharide deacetylase family protein [Verrucomicrobiales bacterium]
MRFKNLVLGTALAVMAFWVGSISSVNAQTFAERLGWKSNDVVIILHVDDVGMSHESNKGTIEAFEKGIANSMSLMMPCPWVPEIAEWLKVHTNVDAGLHLTLTSEWKLYRWGPVAGKSQVPSLVDPQGCMWRSVLEVATKGTADDVEKEIRAQVDRAETLGLPITHLDSHMGTLFARADFFERFAKVGIEKQIPILAPGGHMTHVMKENGLIAAARKSAINKIWDAGLPVIDDLHTSALSWSPEEKKAKLMKVLSELKPGITEILFHCSAQSDNFHLVTGTHRSRWADVQVLVDPDVRKLIEDKGILFTTWRELKQKRDAVGDKKL